MKKLLIYIAVSAALLGTSHADTIFFKNGTRLDIPSAWEENGQIKCQLYGDIVSYPGQDVLRIEKSTPKEGAKAADTSSGNYSASPRHDSLRVSPLDDESKKNIEILSYHDKALELAKKNAWREAIEQEEQAYRIDPKQEIVRNTLASLYNSYGVELKNSGELDEALRTLQDALDYAPDQAQIKKNIAVVYVDMAQKAFNTSNYRACEDYLMQADRYDSNNAVIHVLAGKIAYNSNNYDKALFEWQRALQLNPTLNEVQWLLTKLKRENTIEDKFTTKERYGFNIKFEECDKNDELSRVVIDILSDAYKEVGRDFSLFPEATIPVVIYPKRKLPQLGYFYSWAAGIYDGKIRFGEHLWQQPAFAKSLLYHEYTHVLVRILGGANVPFWLNEGLAEYESSKFKEQTMQDKRKALVENPEELMPLSQVSYSRISMLQPKAISLMYAQSESFVTFLIEQYSFYQVREIVARIGKGDAVEKAVKDVLYEDLESLEQRWKEKFKKD